MLPPNLTKLIVDTLMRVGCADRDRRRLLHHGLPLKRVCELPDRATPREQLWSDVVNIQAWVSDTPGEFILTYLDNARRLSSTSEVEELYRSCLQQVQPSEAPPPIIESGLRIDGQFELCEQIGSGGFGSVWKALDRKAKDTPVAIKILHPHQAYRPSSRQRFEKGARQLGKLRSIPGIVQLYATHKEWRRLHYIVMEFLGAGSLDQAVRSGQWELSDLIRVLVHLAETVERLHRASIIHSDIKPSNVLLSDEGTPKLCDFDLVRAQDTQSLNTSPAGTVLFSAPELHVPKAPSDHRVDIYSLGMMLAFILRRGHWPYEAAFNRSKLIERLPDIPPLVNIARRALAYDPFARYPTVTALVRDLRRAFQRMQGTEDGMDTSLPGDTLPDRPIGDSSPPENLVIFEAAVAPLQHALPTSGTHIVGRGEDANIGLMCPLASREHATISRVGATVWLTDAGSDNGTFLDGRRVREAELRIGDSIRIGSAVLQASSDQPGSLPTYLKDKDTPFGWISLRDAGGIRRKPIVRSARTTVGLGDDLRKTRIAPWQRDYFEFFWQGRQLYCEQHSSTQQVDAHPHIPTVRQVGNGERLQVNGTEFMVSIARPGQDYVIDISSHERWEYSVALAPDSTLSLEALWLPTSSAGVIIANATDVLVELSPETAAGRGTTRMSLISTNRTSPTLAGPAGEVRLTARLATNRPRRKAEMTVLRGRPMEVLPKRPTTGDVPSRVDDDPDAH